MKKNKGFTLVELIAVLTLIALLAILVSNSIATINNKNKKNEQELYKSKIESAACLYVDLDDFNEDCESKACSIHISDLISNGLLNEKTYGDISDETVYVKYKTDEFGVIDKVCKYGRD